MRLCYVVNRDMGGGVYNIARETCRAAAAHGHDATLLTVVPRIRPAESVGITHASLEAEAVDSPDVPARFLRWLNDARPEVVLFANTPGTEEAIPYISGEIRCVMTAHDTAKYWWRNAVRLEQDIDSIIAVSDFVAKQFRSQLRDPGKVTTIWNGATFPDREEWPERNSDLIFLGSPNGMKGDADLAHLWAALVKRGFQGKLHCIGNCEPLAIQALLRLPGNDRVIVHGRVPRERVLKLASQSQVFLALCPCEAFGLAAIEAASMGCLIVTWDIETGITEIIQDGRNGFFAQYGNYEALAQMVELALANHEKLAEEAIRFSRETYSLESMWKKYEAHLSEVLARPTLVRSRLGEQVPEFYRHRKYFNLLPAWLRGRLTSYIRRSPSLHLLTRHLRGR